MSSPTVLEPITEPPVSEIGFTVRADHLLAALDNATAFVPKTSMYAICDGPILRPYDGGVEVVGTDRCAASFTDLPLQPVGPTGSPLPIRPGEPAPSVEWIEPPWPVVLDTPKELRRWLVGSGQARKRSPRTVRLVWRTWAPASPTGTPPRRFTIEWAGQPIPLGTPAEIGSVPDDEDLNPDNDGLAHDLGKLAGYRDRWRDADHVDTPALGMGADYLAALAKLRAPQPSSARWTGGVRLNTHGYRPGAGPDGELQPNPIYAWVPVAAGAAKAEAIIMPLACPPEG